MLFESVDYRVSSVDFFLAEFIHLCIHSDYYYLVLSCLLFFPFLSWPLSVLLSSQFSCLCLSPPPAFPFPLPLLESPLPCSLAKDNSLPRACHFRLVLLLPLVSWERHKGLFSLEMLFFFSLNYAYWRFNFPNLLWLGKVLTYYFPDLYKLKFIYLQL